MIGLLKMFGKGILYVIGFPFFVVALLIFGAIGIFLFAFQLIKSVFYFFTGRKFFPELPEDKELRLMKEKAAGINNQEPEEEPVNEAPVQQEEPIAYTRPPFEQAPITPEQEAPQQGTIEQAVFFDDSPVQHYEPEEEPIQNNIQEQMVEEPEENSFDGFFDDEPVLEREAPLPEPVPEPTPVEEMNIQDDTIETAEMEEIEVQEELEEYVPKGSTYYDDEDEEDTGSGVSIDYDV